MMTSISIKQFQSILTFDLFDAKTHQLMELLHVHRCICAFYESLHKIAFFYVILRKMTSFYRVKGYRSTTVSSLAIWQFLNEIIN